MKRPAPISSKAARSNRVLVEGANRAVLPFQPTDGRQNACWAPPVVAIARFYRLGGQVPQCKAPCSMALGGDSFSDVTLDSVLTLRPADEPEEVCEVLEDATGVWLAYCTWGDDEEFIKGVDKTGGCSADKSSATWAGPTSVCDYGVCRVSDAWWLAVIESLQSGNLILLLVQRLEGGKDLGCTHYLLVFGCEGDENMNVVKGDSDNDAHTRSTRIRRSSRAIKSKKLWLKDAMEGDVLLEAQLWAEPQVELMTRKAEDGSVLDRYRILEATHLKMPALPMNATRAEKSVH